MHLTNKLKLIALFAIWWFINGPIWAQGSWERRLPNGFYHTVLPTPDGGFAVVNTTFDGLYRLGIEKTNAAGTNIWSKHYFIETGFELSTTVQCVLGKDQCFYISATVTSGGTQKLYVLKLNSVGDLIWNKQLSVDSISTIEGMQINTANNILILGKKVFANGNFSAVAIQTDTAAAVQWSRELFENNTNQANRTTFRLAAAVGLNWAIMGADFGVRSVCWLNNQGVTVQKTNLLGNLPNYNHFIRASDNKILVLASTLLNEDHFLLTYDINGNLETQQQFPMPNLSYISSISEYPTNGDLLISGVQSDTIQFNGTIAQRAKLMQLDRQLNIRKQAVFGSFPGTTIFNSNPVLLRDNGTVFLINYNGVDWLVRTNASFGTFSNRITGTLFTDANQNCLPDPSVDGRMPEGTILEITNDNDSLYTIYTVTNTIGAFESNVDTGNYQIQLPGLGPYWEICDAPISVALDTLNVDVVSQITVDPLVECPYMTVDIATNGLRKCFQNTYHVKYCNLGTIATDTARIEIQFGQGLTVNSASIPYTTVGDTLVFQLGQVLAGQCGNFTIEVTPDCDSTELGQSICTTAHIFPDDYCLPLNPLWSGASLELEGKCTAADSIRFRFHNRGASDMTQAVEGIIIEDHVIERTIQILLPAGKDTIFYLPSNGAFWRAEAEQVAFHPGISMPSAAVEGCGGIGSQGFTLQYPQDDADYFIEIDCQEVVGSFDPNDKTGYPLGVTDEKWIRKGQDLEYVIRFQNTGNAAAIHVLVRDTLPAWLDPGTMVPGASSHPYQFSLLNGGIAEFSFPNIYLPDSNSNEPASHGFVKFRIQQRPNLANGTVIENRAAIFFDFNPPVITNYTRHVIGDYLDLLPQKPIPPLPKPSKEPSLIVQPNPIQETAVLTWKGNAPLSAGECQIYQFDGQMIRNEPFEGNQFVFHRKNLPDGLYTCRIYEKGQWIGTGKLILIK
jgi:uncharacterized repeat protein (TIGR01451 family)